MAVNALKQKLDAQKANSQAASVMPTNKTVTTNTAVTGTPYNGQTTLNPTAMANLQNNLKNTTNNTNANPLNSGKTGTDIVDSKVQDLAGLQNATNSGGTGITTNNNVEYDPYSPENLQKLMGIMPQMYQQGQFSYDPNSDVGLKQAQTQAVNRVTQDMVKRGRLYSSFTDSQQQQVSQNLIPQYQQIAYQNYREQEADKRNRYMDEFSRMQTVLGLSKDIESTRYNRQKDMTEAERLLKNDEYKKQQDALNALIKQEETNYNRSRDAITDTIKLGEYGMKQELQPFEIKNKQAEVLKTYADISSKNLDIQTKAFEKQMPGVAMTENNLNFAKGYMNAMRNSEYAPILQKINANKGNYDMASLMEQAKKEGNTDLYNALGYMRYQKIMSDPELIGKYGAEYGVSQEVYKNALDNQKKKIEIETDEINKYLKEIERDYAKPLADIKLEKAVSDLNTGKYEEYIKGVQASYIDEKEKRNLINLGLDAQRTQASISQIYNSINNANRASDRADVSLGLSIQANQRAEKSMQMQINDKELKGFSNIVQDYKTQLENDGKENYLMPNKEGSFERKKLYDILVNEALNKYDDGSLSPEQLDNIIPEVINKTFNFSKKEIEAWNNDSNTNQSTNNTSSLNIFENFKNKLMNKK